MPVHHVLDPSHTLAEMVRHTLAANPHFVGHRVDVASDDDSVVLSGAVATWHQKQVAQESIRDLPGVGRIRNELRVVSR